MKINMKLFFIFLIIIFYLHYTNNKKYNELKKYIFYKKEEFAQLQDYLLENENYYTNANTNTNNNLKYETFDEFIGVSENELEDAAREAHLNKSNENENENETNKERFGNTIRTFDMNKENFDDFIGVSETELKIAAQNAHNDSDNDEEQSTPKPVLGCMDMTALNYNPSASVSDGKCKFT